MQSSYWQMTLALAAVGFVSKNIFFGSKVLDLSLPSYNLQAFFNQYETPENETNVFLKMLSGKIFSVQCRVLTATTVTKTLSVSRRQTYNEVLG